MWHTAAAALVIILTRSAYRELDAFANAYEISDLLYEVHVGVDDAKVSTPNGTAFVKHLGAAGTLDDFEDEEEEEWEAESTSPLDSVSQLAFFAAVAKTLPAELWQKVPAEVRTAAEQLCKKSEEEEQEE